MHGERGYIFRARMIMAGNAAGDLAVICRATRRRRRTELAHPDRLMARRVHEPGVTTWRPAKPMPFLNALAQ